MGNIVQVRIRTKIGRSRLTRLLGRAVEVRSITELTRRKGYLSGYEVKYADIPADMLDAARKIPGITLYRGRKLEQPRGDQV